MGLDLARGVAVLGMFVSHLGPDLEEAGGGLAQLGRGRAAALFTLLAGVSLVLISGRPRPKTGREGRQAKTKIAIRGVVLLVFGTALSIFPGPVDVILAYFGMFFLLALPLTGLPARKLMIIAVVLALVGPLLSFGAGILLDRVSLVQAINADPIGRLTEDGEDSGFGLVFTGGFPAVYYMAYVVGGMALGRLDLKDARVRLRLAVVGPVLMLVGYGGSWLVFRLFPGLSRTLEGGQHRPGPPVWWAGPYTDTDGPASLLVATAHSGTPFEVIGNLGVAITVVAVAVAVVDLPRVRWLLYPVIAVGAMVLSAYVGHIIAIAALDAWFDIDLHWPVLSAFIVGAMVLAVLWMRRFERGPLEYLLNASTRVARHVK